MALEVKDSTFEELIINSDKPALVDFWAEWCGPCRMISPIVAELTEEMEGKAIISKLNVDENPEVCAKYGIRNIPTILFFKGGEIVDKQVGATQKNVLLEKLNALL
jgi:thioredoxin 1